MADNEIKKKIEEKKCIRDCTQSPIHIKKKLYLRKK